MSLQYRKSVLARRLENLTLRRGQLEALRFDNNSHWQDDPVVWAKERLGIELWSKQREVAHAVVDHKRTTVRACHDAGKSFVAAVLACWWIDTHPIGEAFVFTTAPSFSQVAAVLWREINMISRGKDLPGRINLTSWFIGNVQVGMGRKPADYSPEDIQGIHAPAGVLAIIDEADGVPEQIWEAVDSITSNEASRVLAIGNPINPSSHFAKTHHKFDSWHRVQIPAALTPNFSGEPVEPAVQRSLLTPQWVEDKMAEWGGADHPYYVAKVLAEFPTIGENKLISYAGLMDCVSFDPEPTDAHVVAGFDVAAGGADQSCLTLRQGMNFISETFSSFDDATELAWWAARLLNEAEAAEVKIDVIGVGWGPFAKMRELHAKGECCARPVPVNVSERASDPEQYLNLRAQLWYEVARELTMQRAWRLGGISDRTIEELMVVEIQPENAAGRNVVMPKKDMRRQLGRSPDGADALLLAYFSPVVTGTTRHSRQVSAARLPSGT